MANKETRIYKTDTLEKLRQKSNEISLHLGDNEQLNALMADKTYIYSASAGQTLFAGPDTSSPAKTSRCCFSDVTAFLCSSLRLSKMC